MQQRLALARVLLHDPKVLLLDEPASGLDPRARIEIRELLKELHRLGKTILISSHILLELADLCNKIGIIEQGQLRFTGTVQEIMNRASVGAAYSVVVGDGIEAAAEAIRVIPGVSRVEIRDGQIKVILDQDRADPSVIAKAVIDGGFRLMRLEEERVNLETAFMRLTKGLVQ